MEQTPKKHSTSRVIAIIVVALAIFGLFIISNTSSQDISGQVWDEQLTVGETNAKRLYVMYTDLMCPYCDVFSRAMLEHWDEFLEFIAENNILYEIRLTDYLYYGAGSEYSRDSAEAAYCAAREQKFWEFYHGALTALWDDYQSQGIGNNKTAQPIKNLPDDYWLKIGQSVGLGTDFENCVKNRETAEKVAETTNRAARIAEGMPTFKFGKFSTSGFSDTWGWEYVRMYLEAGLGE